MGYDLHDRDLGLRGLERAEVGMNKENCHKENKRKMEEIRRELDSISRTYRSIPATGQNSQIWYFSIQLKPIGEKQHEVNKRAHQWPRQRENTGQKKRRGCPLEKMYDHEVNDVIKTSYQVITRGWTPTTGSEVGSKNHF